MPRLHPNRAFNFFAVERNFNHVFDFEIFVLRRLGTDEYSVVPGELVHRLGQFLQPAVIRETAIVDGGVAAEIEL